MNARTRFLATVGFLYLWGVLVSLDLGDWWGLLPLIPAFLVGWHGVEAWKDARRLDEQDVVIERILANLEAAKR